MMDDNNRQDSYFKRREAWRMDREAKRAAWRARRAARHAGRGDWSHFGDPKFWGLDAESMKAWGLGGGTDGMHGMGSGMGAGMGQSPAGGVADLLAKVAEMEKTIATLHQRVIVLEKLAVNDDTRLAAEIERLRSVDGK